MNIMNKCLFSLASFLCFSFACEASPSRTDFHFGEVFWSPAGSEETIYQGMMIRKCDYFDDTLDFDVTASVFVPENEPQVYHVTYQVDPETHEANVISAKGNMGSAKLIGSAGEWEEIFQRISYVKDDMKLLAVAHMAVEDNVCTIEQNVFLEEESDDSLLGTQSTVLYPISDQIADILFRVLGD